MTRSRRRDVNRGGQVEEKLDTDPGGARQRPMPRLPPSTTRSFWCRPRTRLDVGRGELPLDRMDVGELRIFGRSTKYRIGGRRWCGMHGLGFGSGGRRQGLKCKWQPQNLQKGLQVDFLFSEVLKEKVHNNRTYLPTGQKNVTEAQLGR
jgi:hypothetical protein